MLVLARILREDCEKDLVDVGCNADIYVANQESTDSFHEVHVGDVPPYVYISRSRGCSVRL